MTRWLEFEDVTPAQRKTRILRVLSVKGGVLGYIHWFGRWRQYAFFPGYETVFNPECLRDIQLKIHDLMAQRSSQP